MLPPVAGFWLSATCSIRYCIYYCLRATKADEDEFDSFVLLLFATDDGILWLFKDGSVTVDVFYCSFI